MTALPQYVRLESPGLWRDSLDAQRREVIVVFGDATLMLADARSAIPLTHWSLAALIRRNPGRKPAIFAPSDDPGEILEIADEDMIGAIEKVLSAIESGRPHPGRLRGWLTGAIIVAILAGIALWLPSGLINQAARVATDTRRQDVGRAILADMTRYTGAVCHSTAGDAALGVLAERLPGENLTIAIVPRGLKDGGRMLPGNVVAIGRRTLSGPDTPEAVAGAVVATEAAAAGLDPFLDFMKWAGARAALQLLVTGDLPRGVTRDYGKVVLDTPAPAVAPEVLLSAFRAANLSSTPYAYMTDPSGESVLPLIEADPFKGKPAPVAVLKDAQWHALKAICD